jgi:hypothetical protein
MWRTIHELLGLPPVNLMDKTAASLRDMFTGEPDFTAWDAVPPDARIFDPEKGAGQRPTPQIRKVE